MRSLAIVFPVYNGLAYTKKCIEVLEKALDREKDNLTAYITVVDDGSTDNTGAWLREHRPNVHVLQGDGSLWWSGGMNEGMQYAFDQLNVDYVLCWNNDVVAADDYFTKLVQIINSNGDAGLVCSKVMCLGTDEIFAFGCYFNKYTGLAKINGYGQKETEERYMRNTPVDWAGGMGTLIPREIYKKIGLFDNRNFPQYRGDCDYYLRAKKAGYSITAHFDLRIWNDLGNSVGKSGVDDRRLGSLKELLTSTRSHYNFKVFMRFMLKHGFFTAWFISPVVTYAKLCRVLLKNGIKR
ncbi:MAG TPA: glycosyltransferase family 2 protein [Chitinophaga sp.]